MRIRSIKPEFWSSEDIAAIKDWGDRLLFIGLWSYVDDNGVGRDNEQLIVAALFPLEEDVRRTLARVREGLARLHTLNRIIRYTSDDGKKYLCINNWHHQKIDRPSPGRYPTPTRENTQIHEPSLHTRDDSRALDAVTEEQRNRGTEETSRARARGSRAARATLHEKGSGDDENFSTFWSIYPRRTAKADAYKAWKTTTKKTDPQIIIKAAQAYADKCNGKTETQFIKYPAAWLRAGHWEDEPEPTRIHTEHNPYIDSPSGSWFPGA